MSDYTKIVYSRKLKRFVLTVSVITFFTTVIPIAIILDLSCSSQTYKPDITLRNLTTFSHKSRQLYPNWTPIVDNIVSVYSAFHYKNQTIVIGIIDKDYKELELFCELSSKHMKITTNASIEVLSESWSQFYRFISVKIYCGSDSLDDTMNVKISFNYKHHLFETLPIRVHLIQERMSMSSDHRFRHQIANRKSLVVCVRPLFGPFTSAPKLLEFMAYYRANGIQKFIFYDLDISRQIRQIMLSMSFVELLPFDLPIDGNDIHANGQIAAINDCVLRAANDIVIHVDIDELIVPAINYSNIRQYVSHKMRNSSIGALIIPNVMICDEFNPKNTFPRILKSTIRQTYKWEHRDRSKAIILKPLSVNELGIHTVWKWKDMVINENVDESDAMLFHYRSCCRVWQPLYQNNFMGSYLYFLTYYDNVVNDPAVTRFGTQIIQFLRKYLNFQI